MGLCLSRGLSWLADWLAGLIWLHLAPSCSAQQKSHSVPIAHPWPKPANWAAKFCASTRFRVGSHWQHPGCTSVVYPSQGISGRFHGLLPLGSLTAGSRRHGLDMEDYSYRLMMKDFALNDSEIKRSGICVFSADRTGSITFPGIVRID